MTDEELRLACKSLLGAIPLSERLKRDQYWDHTSTVVQLEIAAQLADLNYNLHRIASALESGKV